MVNPFTNVRRRPGTETGMPARSRAIGIALASATALTMASCHSATPSPQASPEPEPWEKVVAENPLFEAKMTEKVGESLCETVSAALNKKESDTHVEFRWDKKHYSCGGNVSVPMDSGDTIGSGTLRFPKLNEYEQRDLANHILEHRASPSACSFTELVQSSGEGESTERETTNGEYCYYPYTGDSYPASGEGRYVASNTAVTAKFETIDDEADPEQLQQGIDELLDLTMETLLAEYPQP